MYMHVEARSGCQGSSFITPHLVFEAGSHTEPENEPGVCWASEPMRSTCLHTPHPTHPHRSPVLESQTHVTMSGFSGWGWGSELRSFASHAFTVSNLPTDPSPGCHSKLLPMQIVCSFNGIDLRPLLFRPALGFTVQGLNIVPALEDTTD